MTLTPIAKATGFRPEALLTTVTPLAAHGLAAQRPVVVIKNLFAAPAAPLTPATLADAIDGAARLTADEIEIVDGPMRAALEAFRTAQPTYLHWVQLCTAVNVGTAIEHQGVVRGLMAEFDAAFEVLDAIGQRMGTLASTWRPGPLWADELVTLKDLVRLHRFQLQQLSGREFHRARQHAVGRVRSAGGLAYKNGAAALAGQTSRTNKPEAACAGTST